MSAAPLSYIIRPISGARLPIRELVVDGAIVVPGAYVAFETTIHSGTRNGYGLGKPTVGLGVAWKRLCASATPSPLPSF